MLVESSTHQHYVVVPITAIFPSTLLKRVMRTLEFRPRSSSKFCTCNGLINAGRVDLEGEHILEKGLEEKEKGKMDSRKEVGRR